MNAAIDYTIEEIAAVCRGKWLNESLQASQPAYLSLDSRKMAFPDLTVFFAIRTRNKDANLYLPDLYESGVRHFVTDDQGIDISLYPLANIILVKDTIHSLQLLAIHHRKRFGEQTFPVIGITGSNGKTIVKEWLNHLLENEYRIARSPKSYNSQVGVPLSILSISADANLGVFEAGISTPGEMLNLAKIIRPTIGVFTNIGNAHDEGFNSRSQKIREKLKLFTRTRHLIFCAEDPLLAKEVHAFSLKHPDVHLFVWGTAHSNQLRLDSVKKSRGKSFIDAVYKKNKISVKIPFDDEASVQNAIHCLAVLCVIKKLKPEVLKRFESLFPVAMRLELKKGAGQTTIINDSYSNDLTSLTIALDFLQKQKKDKRHTVILSDILQSGMLPGDLYARVASLLLEKHVDHFIGIGPCLYENQTAFANIKDKSFYTTTEAFIAKMLLSDFHHETILIKGARSFLFEKITQRFEEKVHQTVLSINLNSIAFNLKKYREKLKPGTRIMAMVKAFGYGSGSHEIASVLEFNKADYLAVAYADEGVELRKANISLPIMVMNIDTPAFSTIVSHRLEPEIFSFGLLESFTKYLKESELSNYPIHLKIDTGMHRLGFMDKEISQLCKKIALNPFVQVKTVFTHLAASEDPKEDPFTLQQFDSFEKSCQKIERALGYPVIKHLANTSAISRHQELQMDMVRLGIGLYGIDSNTQMQRQLKNVSTLTTTISQIKKLKAGETVGYNRKGKVTLGGTIATVRIGYADGYSRELGNGVGKMMVQNTLAPVIGNVCMDMTMLDITGIKNVKEGDEVIVFGESLPLQTVAGWASTIPYEIMTGISQRVKRVYFEE